MVDKKVKFSTRKPSELVPNEDNPRHMTRVERNKLAQSLKEFDTIPNTRDRQKSLKGTDIFPTRVPTLNNIAKWLGTLASVMKK